MRIDSLTQDSRTPGLLRQTRSEWSRCIQRWITRFLTFQCMRKKWRPSGKNEEQTEPTRRTPPRGPDHSPPASSASMLTGTTPIYCVGSHAPCLVLTYQLLTSIYYFHFLQLSLPYCLERPAGEQRSSRVEESPVRPTLDPFS